MQHDGRELALKDGAKIKLEAVLDEMNRQGVARLPSESALCGMLGVSRVTVRAVLDAMVAEGRVIRRRGSGNYMNPAWRHVRDSIYPFVPFQTLIRKNGHEPLAKNMGVKFMEATPDIAAQLDIPVGEELAVSHSAYYADGRFCVYCKNYFVRASISRQDINRLSTETAVLFSVLLESRGRIMGCDQIEFSATDTIRCPELEAFVPPEERPKPFLRQKTTAYDLQSRPMLFSEYFYDTDYFHYGMVRNMRVDLNEYRNIGWMKNDK